MATMQAYVQQASLGAASEGTDVGLRAARHGSLVVIDFYTQMIMEGRGYQLRMGTISVPTIGDVALTDTAAEAAVDPQLGWTVLPTYLNMSINLGTGTDQECALKSVVTTGVTAPGATTFVPLPLYVGGPGSAVQARATAAGGVTVIAEAVTTTRRHWSFGSAVAVGAGNEPGALVYEPLRPPVIKGPGQLYFQAASTDAGPSYYMNLDWIELPSAAI